jgi:hypothetical protein
MPLAKRTLGQQRFDQKNVKILEIWEWKLFYLLTPALMGDPVAGWLRASC